MYLLGLRLGSGMREEPKIEFCMCSVVEMIAI